MFGIVREVNCNEFALVETRNNNIGNIRVYNVPEILDIDQTIEFDLELAEIIIIMVFLLEFLNVIILI